MPSRPEPISVASCSRVYQATSAISWGSGRSAASVARAVKPSISEAGKGHGWLPTYVTSPA
jgi:hypothetical protein